MKKITKQFSFIVGIIFLMTPILSACFMKTTPLYRVSLFGGAGGLAEFKIGKTTLVSGSSYKKDSKITITVTTYATHTIKRVRAGATTLVADSESQPSEGVTSATYTHKLTAAVTLVVEYDLKDAPPPPPPPDTCGNCGMCSECLKLARDLVFPILDFMLLDIFESANSALTIVAKAKTDINAAIFANEIKIIYRNAMYRLFADLMLEECGCYACSDCTFVVIKGYIIKLLVAQTLIYGNDSEILFIIVDAIREVGGAASVIDAMTRFSEISLEIDGKFIVNDAVNFILIKLENLDVQSNFFKDFDSAREIIAEAIIKPAVIEYPQSVALVVSHNNLGLAPAYMMYTIEAFSISIAQSIVDGGFIKDGQEIAFKLAFLG